MNHQNKYCIIISLLLISSTAFGKLVLEKIIVNGQVKAIVPNSIIQLTSKESDLLLEFSGSETNKNIYEYCLTRSDEKEIWQKVSYPTAHFQQLSWGEYTFKIKKIDQDLVEITSLKISKAREFYEKWWFWPIIALYALLLIGVGIYLFFLYDFRQKLKMQHVRNQIAADLHDEVGSNLNSIAIYTEVLRKKANGESTEILDKITENSKESVSLMQDTVWMINPKNDSNEKLFERMQAFSSQLLASKNIALDYSNTVETKKLNLTMEQRKNSYMIFKEAINNIVKHADASKVSVDIKGQNGEITIDIVDNGCGFEMNKTHEGNGLLNFKERAEAAEFELNISSEIDKGTRIGLKIIA